jgi:hypothetical protein
MLSSSAKGMATTYQHDSDQDYGNGVCYYDEGFSPPPYDIWTLPRNILKNNP